MGKFCRLCLTTTSEDLFELNKSKYRKQLETVIPELNINSIQAPLLCQECSKVIEAAYELKTHSLRVDKYLSVFINIMQTDVVPVSEVFNIKLELDGEFNTLRKNNISPAEIQKTEDNDMFSDECVDSRESLPDSDILEINNDLVNTLGEDDYKENCMIELNAQSAPQHLVNKQENLTTNNLCKNKKYHNKNKVMASQNNNYDIAKHKNIKCSVCGKKFYTHRERRAHNYHYHVKIQYADLVSSIDSLYSITNPFSCKICLRKFTGRISFLDFICSDCEEPVSIKSGLWLYYKQHRRGNFSEM